MTSVAPSITRDTSLNSSDDEQQYIEASVAKSRYRQRHLFANELPGTWASNVRTSGNHSLHTLLPRLGGFPPSLARWVIETHSSPGDVVADPFCGRGTVPLEALIAGRNAVGGDAAPEAYLATRAKTYLAQHHELCSLLHPLQLQRTHPRLDNVDERVRLFFHPETLSQIMDLRNILMAEIGDLYDSRRTTLRREAAILGLACLAGILHGPSVVRDRTSKGFYLSLSCSHTHSQSPAYVRRYSEMHGLVAPVKDVLTCVLRKSATVHAHAVDGAPGFAYYGDARTLPTNRRTQLIFTSPPYFRSQMYAWDNWLRLWLLGFDDYHVIQQQLVQTSSIEMWSSFMKQCVQHFDRALSLSPSATIAIVVGDVRLEGLGTSKYLQGDDRHARYLVNHHRRGMMINSSEIIADILEDSGFKTAMIINDSINPSNAALRSFLKTHHGTALDRVVIAHRK